MAANWFHRFFNPHCPHCRSEVECQTCDTLRILLENERAEKERLLHLVLPSKEPPTRQLEPSELKPIVRHKTWRMQAAELEAQSRKELEIMRKHDLEHKETEVSDVMDELEKEAGIK